MAEQTANGNISVWDTKKLARKQFFKDQNHLQMFFGNLVSYIMTILLTACISAIVGFGTAGLIFNSAFDFEYYQQSPVQLLIYLYRNFFQSPSAFILTTIASIAILAFIFIVFTAAQTISMGMYHVYYNMTKTGKAKFTDCLLVFKNYGKKLKLVIIQTAYTWWPFIIAFMVILVSLRQQLSKITPFIRQDQFEYIAIIAAIVASVSIIIASIAYYILNIKYGLSYLILIDNENISSLDAVKRSDELMKGHMVECILLTLSFAWVIIVAFVISLLGEIGNAIYYIFYMYIMTSYIMATYCNYYHMIIGDYQQVKNMFEQPTEPKNDNANNGIDTH